MEGSETALSLLLGQTHRCQTPPRTGFLLVSSPFSSFQMTMVSAPCSSQTLLSPSLSLSPYLSLSLSNALSWHFLVPYRGRHILLGCDGLTR